MTRRIKRHKDYELALTIRNENFIRPPTDAQRNALLNRSLSEFADHLDQMHEHAAGFVPGRLQTGLAADRTQGELSDSEIMEDWQIPVMQAMAEATAGPGRDVLEVGFGRGVSATMIQQIGAKSHTIIECNDTVIERYEEWRKDFAGKDIRLVRGLWQDCLPTLQLFDGIFFHTYPLNQEEYLKYVHESVTFAEHFFAPAAQHLRPGGHFSYFSNEIDSLSRAHQRALLRHFASFSVRLVELDLPEDVMDTWWSKTIAIVCAVRGD